MNSKNKNSLLTKRRIFISFGLSFCAPIPLLANELRDDKINDGQIKRSLLSFLASRRPYAAEAQKQLLNGLKLELWDTSAKIIFFSASESLKNLESRIISFTIDPSNRRNAKFVNGRHTLLGKSMARTKDKYYLFAIAESNFSLEKNNLISINFGQYDYLIQVVELALVFRNKYIYGGSLRVRKTPEGVERPKFLNHGAMVSMPGEPAINKLCLDLIAGSKSINEKYQDLLDFVTNWIAYDESQFYFGREFLQRANETLIGRIGDCSNKVILYASMLEQIDLPYLLVYTENHITVAVPKGEFDNSNGYEFPYKSNDWIIAETTAKDFKIGKTKVINDSILKTHNYIQNPREKNIIYDFRKNKIIMFS